MSENKIFYYNNLTVFFKHTDYHGCVHPYNYYEWTSYVREAFFQSTVSNFLDVLNRPIKMMTTKIELFNDVSGHFGDNISAELSVGKIKKVSFDMIVNFVNVGSCKALCRTQHSIVFFDTQTNRFASIPDEMKKVILNYEERVQNL